MNGDFMRCSIFVMFHLYQKKEFGEITCFFEFSEVSKAEGRVGQTTNVVIGGTVADDSTSEWLALDQKVDLSSKIGLISVPYLMNT